MPALWITASKRPSWLTSLASVFAPAMVERSPETTPRAPAAAASASAAALATGGVGELLLHGSVIPARDVCQIDRGLGEGHVELLEALHDDARDREVARPFVVSRDDEPGSVFRAGRFHRVLEGGDVVVP